MNPTWKQFRPAATNELAYSTLTLPSIYADTSAWVGYSVCLRRTDIANTEGFSLQPLAEAISDEYVLCVSYPVEGSTTQSIRYKLWEGVGEVVSATLYQGQIIGPGAYLELWTTINSPNPLSITEDVVIETGLTYSRMGSNGSCGSDSGNCSDPFAGGCPPGPAGPPGASATIEVGTTTTLGPGEDATVINSGSSSAAVFDFGIPQGEQGEPGDPGSPGAAATITAGSTTTGAPGSSASVVNVGSSSAAIFDFTIPRGDTGATGAPGPAPSGTGLVAVTAGVLDTPISTSAALAAKISDETGTGALVFGTSPTITTSLMVAGGTVTASTPILNLTQTWNNGAVTFTGLKFNVTDSASASASLSLDIQRNGSSVFSVSKVGNVAWNGSITINSDVILQRGAADVLEMRRTTSAQTFNLYGTTDASTLNYRRIRTTMTTGGAATIAAEGLGTGVSGNTLALVVNAVTALSFSASGTASFSGTVYAGGGSQLAWASRAAMQSPVDGVILLGNYLSTDADIFLKFGVNTSAAAGIKRVGTELRARLNDDSAYAFFTGKLRTDTNYTAGTFTATGYLTIYDLAGTAYRVPCAV